VSRSSSGSAEAERAGRRTCGYVADGTGEVMGSSSLEMGNHEINDEQLAIGFKYLSVHEDRAEMATAPGCELATGEQDRAGQSCCGTPGSTKGCDGQTSLFSVSSRDGVGRPRDSGNHRPFVGVDGEVQQHSVIKHRGKCEGTAILGKLGTGRAAPGRRGVLMKVP
jgi:hypothetical protein